MKVDGKFGHKSKNKKDFGDVAMYSSLKLKSFWF